MEYAARFGGYFGIAFQIMDDLLDILRKPKTIGKPAGNDLKEGIITLPVLLAAAKDPDIRRLVLSYLRSLGKKRAGRDMARIVRCVARADAIGDAKAILNRLRRQGEKIP